MITNKKVVIPLAALAIVISAGGGVVAIAKADTANSTTTSTISAAHGDANRPTAMGKVTAVSGSTITITDMKGSTTYTVDASGATVTKHNPPTSQGGQPTDTTVAVSDIQVGDMIAVHGTMNGTQITATTIDVGMFGSPRAGMRPGVHGKVTAVNGTTMTVTSDDGTSYTVDTSGATATKMETISASDIQVGDSVGIDGTVSGTDVSAKRIMDGMPQGTHK